jgi:hypothetical protein
MAKWRFAALAFLVILLGLRSEAQGQGPNMQIGPINVHLGMTKGEVQNKIDGLSVLKADEDSWIITTGGPESEPYGNIQFTNGRITYASRSWLRRNSDAIEGFLGAINSFNKEGLSTCTVLHDTISTPTITGERVSIICGEKSLLIIKSKFEGKPFEDITEQIGAMK